MTNKYLRYLLPVIAIIILVEIIRRIFSTITIIDPSEQHQLVAMPFDVVVEHVGCGTVDNSSFRAVLDKDQANTLNITSKFSHPSDNRWVLDEFNSSRLSEGKHTLTINLELTEDSICLHSNEFRRDFEVLPSLPDGRFEALIYHMNDKDLFKIQAPKSSDFGRIFVIRVQTKPEYPDHELFFRLHGPIIDDNLKTTKEPDSTIWVALKSGIDGWIEIRSESVFPPNVTAIPYEITVESRGIPDLQEPNDERNQAAKMPYLPKDQTKEFYMASVLDVKDEQGKRETITVGIPDWFKIDHHDCHIDCITISPTAIQYDLEHCKNIEPSCIGAVTYKTTHFCTSTDGAANEEGDGDRYLGVICSPNDCKPYGILEISGGGLAAAPERYLSPYTITWNNGGEYDISDTGRCERD